MVKSEFDRLEEGAKIYKLVGSVLVQQTLKESNGTLKKRLEFIGNESKKTEALIKENEAK